MRLVITAFWRRADSPGASLFALSALILKTQISRNLPHSVAAFALEVLETKRILKAG
jgi:hypothetical protein